MSDRIWSNIILSQDKLADLVNKVNDRLKSGEYSEEEYEQALQILEDFNDYPEEDEVPPDQIITPEIDDFEEHA